MSRVRPAVLALLGFGSLALLLAVLLSPNAVPVAAQGLPNVTWRFEFLRQWAHQPPPGVFNHQPTGMAFDQAGNLYVVDRGNHRIQVLDSQGRPLRTFGNLGNGPGEFYVPKWIALDAAGNVYVSDTANHRVQKLTPDGTPLAQWGGFWYPQGIGIGSDGSIYVSDNPYVEDGSGGDARRRPRIQKLSPDGLSRRTISENLIGFAMSLKVKRELGVDVIYLVGQDGMGGGVVQKYSSEGVLLTQWNDLRLTNPADIEVDKDGNLYITDQNADTVVVRAWRDRQQVTETWRGFLTPQGIAQGPNGLLHISDGEGGGFGSGYPTAMRIQRFTSQGQLVSPAWGSDEGHAPGQLVSPYSIAWSPTGHIWVHDASDGRLQQFTPQGVFVRQTAQSRDFRAIRFLKVDKAGNLLISRQCQMLRLSPEGAVLQTFQSDPPCAPVTEYPQTVFAYPHGFDLDDAGHLYVADPYNHRVVMLDDRGSLQRIIGAPTNLNKPRDVAVDAEGRVYVLDDVEVSPPDRPDITLVWTRIQVYDSLGTLEATWRIPDTSPGGRLDDASLSHIEVDSDGYVYVSDLSAHTIWKLAPGTGNRLARIEPGGYGAGPGQFDDLTSYGAFTLDSSGSLYTVEAWNNHRVQVFAQIAAPVIATETATPTATTLPVASATSTVAVTVPPGMTATPTATPTVTASMLAGIATSTQTATPTSTDTPQPPTPTSTPTVTLTHTPASPNSLFLPYVVR